MELCIVGRLAKGHRSLGVDRAGGSCGLARGCDGAVAGIEQPSISSSSAMELRVQSMVTMEHDCGAAVESLLENGDSGIRLEASGQRGYDY
jgi:hypothetical protein